MIFFKNKSFIINKMTTLTGNNLTYTVNNLFDSEGKVIERTGLTGNSIDTFPTGTEISEPYFGQIGVYFDVVIYNSDNTYTITILPGSGGTMKPGIPGGEQKDIIQPNSLKRYTFVITSSTTCNIFNLDNNGQTIVTEKIITNNIEKEPGSGEVTIYENVSNIIFGSGGSSSNDDGSMTLYGNLFKFSSVAELNATSDISYSVGQIMGGLILRDPGNSNREDTLPDAANIVAAIPKVTIGSSFVTRIQNTGSKKTITIKEGTGITISGTDTSISKERTKMFLFVVTNKNSGSEAVTAYIMGSLLDSDYAAASLVANVTSTSYTVLESDNTINVNYYHYRGYDVTITLPEISTVGQKRYFITDVGGNASRNNIIVVTGGSDTIVGEDSVTINSDYSSISMYNDEDSNWILY